MCGCWDVIGVGTGAASRRLKGDVVAQGVGETGGGGSAFAGMRGCDVVVRGEVSTGVVVGVGGVVGGWGEAERLLGMLVIRQVRLYGESGRWLVRTILAVYRASNKDV